MWNPGCFGRGPFSSSRPSRGMDGGSQVAARTKALPQRRMGLSLLSGEEIMRFSPSQYGVRTGMFGAAHLSHGLSTLTNQAFVVEYAHRLEESSRGVPSDAFGLLVGEGRVVYRITLPTALSLARRMTGDIKRLAQRLQHTMLWRRSGRSRCYLRQASIHSHQQFRGLPA